VIPGTPKQDGDQATQRDDTNLNWHQLHLLRNAGLLVQAGSPSYDQAEIKNATQAALSVQACQITKRVDQAIPVQIVVVAKPSDAEIPAGESDSAQ